MKRMLCARLLCNSRIEESQGMKNKKIKSRRSARSKQKNDLLSGSFPLANYRSTKDYYNNSTGMSYKIQVIKKSYCYLDKIQIRMMSFSLTHTHPDIFICQETVISYKCGY